MPTPGEHKTVQARILAYADEICWTYVPRGEAEKRRGFDHSRETPAEQAADKTHSSLVGLCNFANSLCGRLRRHQSQFRITSGSADCELRVRPPG